MYPFPESRTVHASTKIQLGRGTKSGGPRSKNVPAFSASYTRRRQHRGAKYGQTSRSSTFHKHSGFTEAPTTVEASNGNDAGHSTLILLAQLAELTADPLATYAVITPPPDPQRCGLLT